MSFVEKDHLKKPQEPGSMESILERLPVELGSKFTERLRKRKAFADENLDSVASLNNQLNSLIYSTKTEKSNSLIYNVFSNDSFQETYQNIFSEHLKYWIEEVI